MPALSTPLAAPLAGLPTPSSLLSEPLQGLTGALVYLVVWGIVFISAGVLVVFFLPGSSLLFASGLLAASAGSGVDIWVLSIGTFTAGLLGNQVGYASGRRLGRPYLERRTGPRMSAQLARTESFYARYGSLAVVSARFIPWVRTFMPFVAGIARMHPARFLVASIAGALTWCVGITVSGYFAASIPIVRSISYGVAGFFILGTFIYLGIQLVRSRRRRSNAVTD